MDKFKNRLKYFLIGLSIGIILVYFMFGTRSCSWLPGNQVKIMVGEKAIMVGDSILAVMDCLELSNDDVYELLKDGGDVEFSESKTSGYPKIYLIEAYKGEEEYFARFALYSEDSYSEIVEINYTEPKPCNVTVSNYYKSTLPLPHADVMAILEAHDFRILPLAECQIAEYGINEDSLFNFHKTAEIVINASEPRRQPNPFYIMDGKLNGDNYRIKYIIGENRTRIAKITGAVASECIDPSEVLEAIPSDTLLIDSLTTDSLAIID